MGCLFWIAVLILLGLMLWWTLTTDMNYNPCPLPHCGPGVGNDAIRAPMF